MTQKTLAIKRTEGITEDFPLEDELLRFCSSVLPDVDLGAIAVVLNLTVASTVGLSTLEAAVLRPRNLSLAGFWLLGVVELAGPSETRELANFLHVSRPAIVSLVNTLERAGLVRRIPSQIDRRLVSVALTEDGAKVPVEVRSEWHEWQKKITSELTPREKKTLVALLKKLTNAAQAASNEIGAPLNEKGD
jgi:DNA-binding MarR family transcriptional regulator